MEKAYSKLFTGALFIFININIGTIDIILDFIGYIIMLNGLSMLYKETSISFFRIANIIGILLLIKSVAGIFFPNNILAENIAVTLVMWMVISEFIQLLFVYFIYSASIELLTITVVHTFIPNIDVDIRTIILIITGIVSFIMVIDFLINLNRIKKYFYTSI